MTRSIFEAWVILMFGLVLFWQHQNMIGQRQTHETIGLMLEAGKVRKTACEQV